LCEIRQFAHLKTFRDAARHLAIVALPMGGGTNF